MAGSPTLECLKIRPGDIKQGPVYPEQQDGCLLVLGTGITNGNGYSPCGVRGNPPLCFLMVTLCQVGIPEPIFAAKNFLKSLFIKELELAARGKFTELGKDQTGARTKG